MSVASFVSMDVDSSEHICMEVFWAIATCVTMFVLHLRKRNAQKTQRDVAKAAVEADFALFQAEELSRKQMDEAVKERCRTWSTTSTNSTDEAAEDVSSLSSLSSSSQDCDSEFEQIEEAGGNCRQ
jgi:hypothetical protein